MQFENFKQLMIEPSCTVSIKFDISSEKERRKMRRMARISFQVSEIFANSMRQKKKRCEIEKYSSAFLSMVTKITR